MPFRGPNDTLETQPQPQLQPPPRTPTSTASISKQPTPATPALKPSPSPMKQSQHSPIVVDAYASALEAITVGDPMQPPMVNQPAMRPAMDYDAQSGFGSTEKTHHNWPFCVPFLSGYCLFATLVFAGAVGTFAMIEPPASVGERSVALAIFAFILLVNGLLAFIDMLASWDTAHEGVRVTWQDKHRAAGRLALVAIINTAILIPSLFVFVLHQRGDEFWDVLRHGIDADIEDKCWWVMGSGCICVVLSLCIVIALNNQVHGNYSRVNGASIIGTGASWMWRVAGFLLLVSHGFLIYALAEGLDLRYSVMSVTLTVLYALFALPVVLFTLTLPFGFHLDETIKLSRDWFDRYRALLLVSTGTAYGAVYAVVFVLMLFGSRIDPITMMERSDSPFWVVRDLPRSREVIVWTAAGTYGIYLLAVLLRLYLHKFTAIVPYAPKRRRGASRPLMSKTSTSSPSTVQMTDTTRPKTHEIAVMTPDETGQTRLKRSRTFSMTPADAERLRRQRSPTMQFHRERPHAQGLVRVSQYQSPDPQTPVMGGSGLHHVLDSTHRVPARGGVHIYR